MTAFGNTKNGDPVEAITLKANGLTATILTFGAILQDLRLEGIPHSLTPGSETLASYEGEMAFHGAIVGPVVNRLRNARAVIDGYEHMFDPNLNRQHTLHSGSAGTHKKMWKIVFLTEERLLLSLILPDGEAGFPSNRSITADFEILVGPALRLKLTTTTDGPSIANVTNHSYWNLDGTDHMRDHTVRIAADYYLPTDDADFLPTGEIVSVAETPFDFRRSKPLAPANPPLDTTFCVARTRRVLTDCLWLRGASGLHMTVATTEPGVHLYDARAAHRPNGPFYEGLAVETQGWPDAPNNPNFPSIEITPEAPAAQITEWRFNR